MKIIHGKYIVETDGIKAVTIEENNFGGICDYNVHISFSMSGTSFRFSSEEEANELIDKIIHSMEEDDLTEKTYLDGFKEGTEYALKLIRTQQ